MTLFESCFEKVVAHEGGYVSDSRDPGGETNYGISKRAYPSLDIKALTLADAKAIYKRDDMDKLGGAIFAKLDRIEAKLDGKADKP